LTGNRLELEEGYEGLEFVEDPIEVGYGGVGLLSARAGTVGGLGESPQFGGDGSGGLGNFGQEVTHFRGGSGLLLYSRGDGLVDLEHLAGDGGNGANAFDAFAGILLNGGDALADLVGGGSGTLGEFLDFVGDDGETPSRIAGTGCFDGGIEGQEVGLVGDGCNELDDLADVRGGLAEMGDGLGGGLADVDR